MSTASDEQRIDNLCNELSRLKTRSRPIGLSNNSVKTSTIRNSAVTGTKVAPLTLSGGHLADCTICDRTIKEISGVKVIPDSLPGNRISDNSIPAGKLGPDSITTVNISTDAVLKD